MTNPYNNISPLLEEENKNNITINSLQSSIVDNTLESSSGSLIFTSTNDSENYFTTSTSNTTIT
ncbi:15607_t:CDS:2, partial [Entrophospora sp. SA101]